MEAYPITSQWHESREMLLCIIIVIGDNYELKCNVICTEYQLIGRHIAVPMTVCLYVCLFAQ